MKFILRTKDGKFYLKTCFRQVSVFTEERSLAMRFASRSEANRIGMVALHGEFEVVKI